MSPLMQKPGTPLYGIGQYKNCSTVILIPAKKLEYFKSRISWWEYDTYNGFNNHI